MARPLGSEPAGNYTDVARLRGEGRSHVAHVCPQLHMCVDTRILPPLSHALIQSLSLPSPCILFGV